MPSRVSNLPLELKFHPPPDIPTQPYESEQLKLMGVSLLRSARRLVEPGREDPEAFKCHRCDDPITGSFCYRFSGCMFPSGQIVHWVCNWCKERCLGEKGNEKLAWRCLYGGVHISERSITPLLPPFIRHKIPADVRCKVRTIMKQREQNQKRLQGAIRQKQHDGRYHCGMCEKTFKTSYGRTKHLQIHGESRVCAACKKEFTTAESLRRHQKRKSCKAMEEYIPCQHCGKEFPRANGYNRRRHEGKCSKHLSSYGLKINFLTIFHLNA
ncbi:unnamed protein product [Orchesella dallaii]|uniref:C2H2-type domain-containing protein n=1 Tax=Orchesella dallaii TaxID=48710 RepID=A0ABP1PM52_9HEXA